MHTPTVTRKMLALGAAVALAAGLLASCGNDDDTDALDDPTTTTAPTTTEAETTTTTTTEALDGEVELLWVVEPDEDSEDRDNISSLAVHPDGDTIYSGHFLAVRTRHVADGELVEVFLVDHTAKSLDVSPDGELLAVGLGVGGVSVHDPMTGDEVLRLGSGFDSQASFAPDGAMLATGSRDGNVILWSLPDGTEQATLADPAPGGGPIDSTVVGLDWHPGGDQLAVTHFDCSVNVWDTVSGAVIAELELYSGDGSCGLATTMLRYSPDAEHLVGALNDEDGESVVRFWSLDGFEADFDVAVPERVRDLDFSPDGSLLAVGSRLETNVIDVEARSVLYTFDQDIEAFGLEPRPNTIAFTMDGGHVAVGWDDGRLEMWRLPGAEELVAPEREVCDPVPIPGDVLFDTGSSDLRSEADAALGELAEELADSFPDATLTFVGHTDSRGSADANQQLSLARATSTRDWFATWAADNGIDGWTLDVDGRGDTQLRVPDTNAEGDFLPDAGALNRRVEITIDAPACA